MLGNEFFCFIDDAILGDHFSAKVKVELNRNSQRSNLADIYIEPVSGQRLYYKSKVNWSRTAEFNVPTKEYTGPVHNHFALLGADGKGLLIIRDNYRREVARRECSAWDLGAVFAIQVLETFNRLRRENNPTA